LSVSSVREEIERVVREVLAPLIGADGGEVWLVSAEDTSVILHLGGRYAGCPGNTLTKRRIIEPAINKVAPRVQITVTSGVLVPPGAERLGSR
jgi:Fe-S cluster biogenesis protein NfuA